LISGSDLVGILKIPAGDNLSFVKRDLLKFVNRVMTLFSGNGAVLEWAATHYASGLTHPATFLKMDPTAPC
jgi:hypothetical protein